MWGVDCIKPAYLNVYIYVPVQVFTEALLHMALNHDGPKAADGQDRGPLQLEEQAESVVCLASGGVGRTEASRGQESGAGAAHGEQARNEKNYSFLVNSDGIQNWCYLLIKLISKTSQSTIEAMHLFFMNMEYLLFSQENTK